MTYRIFDTVAFGFGFVGLFVGFLFLWGFAWFCFSNALGFTLFCPLPENRKINEEAEFICSFVS